MPSPQLKVQRSSWVVANIFDGAMFKMLQSNNAEEWQDMSASHLSLPTCISFHLTGRGKCPSITPIIVRAKSVYDTSLRNCHAIVPMVHHSEAPVGWKMSHRTRNVFFRTAHYSENKHPLVGMTVVPKWHAHVSPTHILNLNWEWARYLLCLNIMKVA